MSRRVLLALAGCALALATACGSSPGPLGDGALADARPAPDRDVARPPDSRRDAPPRRRLVVVTLNTHSFQEGPTSLAKLTAIGDGLAALQADLVGLNEVMSGTFWSYDYKGAVYDGTALIKTALEKASGVAWYAVVHTFAHWGTGEAMSNVLLSRTPVVASASRPLTTTDSWPAPKEQRAVTAARTIIPGAGAVTVFVTHAWGWDSLDTTAQIAEVKSFMVAQAQGDVVQLLLGDLNMPATRPAYHTWLDALPLPLVDTYAQANPQGAADSTTFDGSGRIDYILATGAPTVARSRLIFDGGSAPGSLPVVSDHKGVLTELLLP